MKSGSCIQEIRTEKSVAEIAQSLLFLQGHPYSLKQYPMFVDIFNSGHKRVLMRSGRQVSKTVTLAAKMVTSALCMPYTPVLYCNASSAQTSSFSTSKLAPFLLQSPVVFRNFMQGPKIIDNVFNKRLSNFSEIRLSYFSENADRVRGNSADSMYLDEIQDMLYDAMIDAEECMSAAQDPRVVYAGTSKTTNTPLEYLWQLSTRKEWIIRCEGCGKWNRPSRENIGLRGLICKKCGHELDTFSGHWHSQVDSYKASYVDGYWIPQIIMPIHCCSAEKWARLLEKLENYPEVKFDNEVMGMPSGEGDSPITEATIRAACRENILMQECITEENAGEARYIVAGIDWGGGGQAGVSRTVLSIFAVYPELPLYRLIYGKIYDNGEPVRHVEDIAARLIRFGTYMVCGDHGGGNFALSQLRGLLPGHMRLIPIMYSDASSPYRWDDRAYRYIVNRTVLIDDFFTDLKKGVIECFRWSEFQHMAKDILAVRQIVIGEDRGLTRRVWRHAPQEPDDSLHSMVFGWFGARVMSNRMDFTPAL